MIDSLDDELLEKVSGADEDEKCRREWTDYFLDGKLIHRSVRVELKKPLTFSAAGIGEVEWLASSPTTGRTSALTLSQE